MLKNISEEEEVTGSIGMRDMAGVAMMGFDPEIATPFNHVPLDPDHTIGTPCTGNAIGRAQDDPLNPLELRLSYCAW